MAKKDLSRKRKNCSEPPFKKDKKPFFSKGPSRETAPCGATIKKGGLSLHMRTCSDALCSGAVNELQNIHQIPNFWK